MQTLSPPQLLQTALESVESLPLADSTPQNSKLEPIYIESFLPVDGQGTFDELP